MHIEIKRLESGYYHISGPGPCNWSQPEFLSETAIRSSAFPQASEEFLTFAVAAAKRYEQGSTTYVV